MDSSCRLHALRWRIATDFCPVADRVPTCAWVLCRSVRRVRFDLSLSCERPQKCSRGSRKGSAEHEGEKRYRPVIADPAAAEGAQEPAEAQKDGLLPPGVRRIGPHLSDAGRDARGNSATESWVHGQPPLWILHALRLSRVACAGPSPAVSGGVALRLAYVASAGGGSSACVRVPVGVARWRQRRWRPWIRRF